MPPAEVENDFQPNVTIGTYYKFPKADRTKSSRQLSSEFTLSNETQLSARTIRRRLFDAEYRSYTDKRKPIRNVSQTKVHLQFANDYIPWLPYDWKRIIWTDEAHFELFNRKNRTLIRRFRSESEKPFSFVPRMQKGGGSIILWGCMTSEEIDDLVFYNGRVNARRIFMSLVILLYVLSSEGLMLTTVSC